MLKNCLTTFSINYYNINDNAYQYCRQAYFFLNIMIMTISHKKGAIAMTLAQAKRGQFVEITAIPNDAIRAQAIRFGIAEGAKIECAEKLPAGPVIICKGRQEIAIGRKLAENIEVKPA
jgi:ferrous iron transport protein A